MPGLVEHPFHRQLRHARDQQLRGTLEFEFPCADKPQLVALHAALGAANAWAQDHRREMERRGADTTTEHAHVNGLLAHSSDPPRLTWRGVCCATHAVRRR